MIRLEQGDMLDVIPRLVAEGVVCDSCVCDPPYHLIQTQKRFGSANSAPAQWGRDGAMARLSGGFMGQKWDGGDIAFRPETWETVSTILRPGGFLLAFGGTRTYHRLACAIEDAGFVIQDCLMWLFGTGLPKRRDMLKPSFEPVVVAYKPGGKRKLSIDECRIGTESTRRHSYADIGYHGGLRASEYSSGGLGRWPANVCHDGSDEVVALFPAARSAKVPASAGDKGTGNGCTYAPIKPQGAIYSDSGSAARFFFSAKADRHDRWGSRHPTVKPVELMKWLVALVTPPGGTIIDPFSGSGTTGVAAFATSRNCILIEREEQYCTDIRERLAFYEGDGAHSVKAINRNRAVDLGPLFSGAAE